MLILLDECVHRQIRPLLVGHDIRTAHEMGWAGFKNRQLLRTMAAQSFQVLLTIDQNLRYQQNPSRLGIAVLVLVAPTSRIEDLALLIPQALVALANIAPDVVVEISAS